MKFVARLDPDLALLGEQGPAALALRAALAADVSLDAQLVPAGRLLLEFGPFLPVTGGGGEALAVAEAPINGHRGVAYTPTGGVVHWAGVPFTLAGVVLSSAAPGASVQVVDSGTVSFEGWSWIDGPVFVVADGVLTQTLSGSVAQVVGRGSGQRLHVNIQPPIGVL